jgi:hypothetical protein
MSDRLSCPDAGAHDELPRETLHMLRMVGTLFIVRIVLCSIVKHLLCEVRPMGHFSKSLDSHQNKL